MNAKDVKTIELLEKMHPDAECELHFGSPFELLVAVILSAQCTDKRVNEVTKHLFKRANTPRGIVEMPLEELEKEIFSCGFYHSKARALKEMSAAVLERGGVPEWGLPRRTPRRRRKSSSRRVLTRVFGADCIISSSFTGATPATRKSPIARLVC